MKHANLQINFQLTKPVEAQLLALDILLPELEKRGITITSARIGPVPSASKTNTDEMGPLERQWLEISGRSRMNMRDKSLSREDQAQAYIMQHLSTDSVPDSTDAIESSSEEESSDPFKF